MYIKILYCVILSFDEYKQRKEKKKKKNNGKKEENKIRKIIKEEKIYL